ARQRFIVKAFALLIEPDVAGRETEDQTAAPLGVAIIRRGINVKPDVIHMREVATQLANHFVTRAGCAEARAFHDLEGFELGPILQDHIEIRIKAPRRDYDALAVNLETLFFSVRRRHPADAAVVGEQFTGRSRSHKLNVRQRIGGLDERRHEAETVIVGPVPAHHTIALLKLHIGPFYAAALGPVIKVMKRMLEIKSCPYLVGGTLSPLHPILEGDVWRV